MNGWTMEMIGLVFGHPKGHVTRIVRDIKAELSSGFLKEFAQHKADSFVAVQTMHAETLLDRFEKVKSLLRPDDEEMTAAITALRDQLAKWEMSQ